MTDIERQIAETIERVSRALARAGAPADVEDIAQEGWIVALEALAGFDAARGALPPYLKAVLRPSLGKAVARWADPCSITEWRARHAVAVECAPVDGEFPDEALTPEQLLAVAESRARAAAAVAGILAAMGKRAAEIVALDPDATSAQVAARAGVSSTYVRRSRIAFRERAVASRAVREAVRAIG